MENTETLHSIFELLLSNQEENHLIAINIIKGLNINFWEEHMYVYNSKLKRDFLFYQLLIGSLDKLRLSLELDFDFSKNITIRDVSIVRSLEDDFMFHCDEETKEAFIRYYNVRLLDTFPLELLKLKELQSLSIECQGIKSIPPEISELKELECLYLGGNPIETIDEAIFALPKLEYICLGGSLIHLEELKRLEKKYPKINIVY